MKDLIRPSILSRLTLRPLFPSLNVKSEEGWVKRRESTSNTNRRPRLIPLHLQREVDPSVHSRLLIDIGWIPLPLRHWRWEVSIRPSISLRITLQTILQTMPLVNVWSLSRYSNAREVWSARPIRSTNKAFDSVWSLSQYSSTMEVWSVCPYPLQTRHSTTSDPSLNTSYAGRRGPSSAPLRTMQWTANGSSFSFLLRWSVAEWIASSNASPLYLPWLWRKPRRVNTEQEKIYTFLC